LEIEGFVAFEKDKFSRYTLANNSETTAIINIGTNK